jgi:FtsP/CotA-like multicopper oxidase with cupredoxin domain
VSHITNNNRSAKPARLATPFLLLLLLPLLALLCLPQAQAAAPGITGTTFNLNAADSPISQPDGMNVYSWGYGCSTAPSGFSPAGMVGAACSTMQVPGPTLIVHQGDKVTVTLTNNLPAAAGNTSILFPGFQVCTAVMNPDGSCPTVPTGVPGLLTREAAHGGSVTYSFIAATAGTHSYYSGTQGDLQIEMGLYGAIIVLPTAVPAGCRAVASTLPDGQPDYRNAAAAYNHSASCYDREYLFQFAEMDPRIHSQAQQQAAVACAQPTGCMTVETEHYHPAY